MAFPSQTVDTTKIGSGHVRLRLNSNSTNPVPTVVARVASVDKIDFAQGTYEHMAYNADGTSQVAAIFQNKAASGKVELTLDQVQDVDASTLFGFKTDVDLTQAFPKNSSKGWRVLYPKALVEPVDLVPSFDKPTTLKIRITPYNDPGTAAYSFNDDYTL
jgi:hypothetical protein